MKADSHDSVCVIEGFLNSIPMVNIDVEVKHSWVHFEELEDAEHDVVDVAEPAGFCFLRMVEPSRPVNHDVPLSSDHQISCIDAPSGCQFAEIKEALKARAVKGLIDFENGSQFDIFPDFDLFQFFIRGELLNDGERLGRNPGLQVLDVVRVVEVGHFLRGGFLGMVDLELGGKGVVIDEAVHHFHPFGFHGVLLAELVLCDVLVVEIADLSHQLAKIIACHFESDHSIYHCANRPNSACLTHHWTLNSGIFKMIILHGCIDIRINISIDMWTQIILLTLLLVSASPSCVNLSSCFLQRLFDFNYPEEKVYSIALNEDLTSLDNVVLGYGDFNNDLHADYVALNTNSNDLLIFFYSTDQEFNGQYIIQATQTILSGCKPVSVYMYDVDSNGLLDVTVWGQYDNSTNCLYPILQTDVGVFSNGIPSPVNFQKTTQPILFESSAMLASKTEFLMLYNSLEEARKILFFNFGNYTSLNWTTIFQSSRENINFSDQHWNSFIDLTDDCYPDMVVTNENNEIQFWIFGQNSKYHLKVERIVDVEKDLKIQVIKTLSFQDVDYDGEQDLIVANETTFMIYRSNLVQSGQFCTPGKTTLGFNFSSPTTTIAAPPDCTIVQQNIHFGDINSDGYPDLLFICKNTQTQNTQVVFYQNMYYQSSGDNFVGFKLYQAEVDGIIDKTLVNVTGVSVFDILENGILDFMVTVNANRTVALYNNYLYQNFYYIKGLATNGVNTSSGIQIPGASFYWLNSLGNSQRTAVYSQMFQTAYGAVPAPYVLTGLGKANNYVEQFTIGRLGDSKSWSPIIPNSQLAVYCGETSKEIWMIKIFIMPTDSIVYVLIVCVVILTILGSVLAVLKCRSKKRENYLYKGLNDQ